MLLSYFPGCSLHSTAREYGDSVRAVCGALEIGLRELEDWNCCGSTSAHSTNAELARLLPLRNLEIAERAGLDLMVPCAACYGRSKAASAASGSRVKISHFLEVLAEEEALEQLREKVVRPLVGLRAVCYYGCLTSRPPRLTGAADWENPEGMDLLLEAAGATPLPWSCKTDCCGASLTLSRADVVIRLVDRLLAMAGEAGAECLVVACSMCHANLEARQSEIGLPVFYISELLGLALGLPGASRWWKRHLIDPLPLLGARGLV